MSEKILDIAQSPAIGFIPPAPTHSLIKICQTFWASYAKLSEFKLSVHLDGSIRNVFQKLAKERVILCPNHCAHDDPLVAFAISAQLNQQFYYLTAREIFMWHPSLRSLWLQHLGCYSVLRSSPDVEAYKETCSLLLKGPNKIVIFPEGEVTHQNRFVMSLESGPERMAITTAQALSAIDSDEPVFILPVGIVYRYSQDISEKLREILALQEIKLGIKSSANKPIGDRLLNAFTTMLDALESEHRCGVPHPLSVGARVNCFVERTVQEIAAACNVSIPEGFTQRERLHILKKIFINHRYAQQHPVVSDYERLLYRQIKRAVNLIGITDESFNNLDTQESVAELVCILECEISGRITLRSDRHAYVASDQPIDVRQFALSGNHKKASINALTKELSSGINYALLYLNASSPEHPMSAMTAAPVDQFPKFNARANHPSE